ncbi:hypothetical protein CEUSTIGMA_g7082.t1 [Chlamydomonas eustigma]|uniref:Uncharacterized protein n=1 Tax=Chlamydomonas eustigma TaxID=1157962 RepID=A0A250X997_9CHLO|nr:hypothetical protein CEUSTIGMA_g7082.t1 [Chlamydomonas eustigma]|eukprot:GAX79641.1 hypothetical protein CEUSTIGMA_g7082.t1 [Chlamydomonas eustigma]
MPPKANIEVTEVKQNDLNPYGAFINVSIPAAVLSLDVPARPPTASGAPAKVKTPPGKTAQEVPPPPPHEPDAPPPPQTHFSLAYSTVLAPVEGDATVPAPKEVGDKTLTNLCYNYHFEKGFRFDATLTAAELLINTKVVIQLHDTASNGVLAAVTLDMLPFARGKQVYELTDIQLTPESRPEGSVKLLSGSIQSLKVYTTYREAPHAPSPSNEGEVKTPEVKPPDAPTPAVPSEEQLVEPQPYRFVSEEDVADGCNVVELGLPSIAPIPPTLQAALDLVRGKDGLQGKINFQLAVALPAPCPTLKVQGQLSKDGTIVFDAPKRFILSADAAEKLRTQLEAGQPLAIEVARYVTNEAFVDNAWEAYHGMSWVSESSTQGLLVDGTVEVAEDALPLVAWAAGVADKVEGSQLLGSGCLPAYAAPAKGKPVEPEVLPGTSAWQLCGAAVQNFSIKLCDPIVPIWSPPSEPERKLTDLVPTRDLHPAPPPPTASDDFQKQVDISLSQLVDTYLDHKSVSDQNTPAADPAMPVAQRHRELIFQLNHSGAYTALREGLKAPLLRVVKEELGASGAMSKREMEPLYGKLYKRLMNLVHIQLARVKDGTLKPVHAVVPSYEESSHLLGLATQYEESGLWLASNDSNMDHQRGQNLLHRAENLHQRRLLDSDNEHVWYDHATFSMRLGHLDSALSSARKCLEINPAHPGALLLTAAVTLTQAVRQLAVRDTEVAGVVQSSEISSLMETACVAGHALVVVSGNEQGIPWAFLAILYSKEPSLPGPNRHNQPWSRCRQQLSLLERRALAAQQPPAEANAFFQLRNIMLTMHLPELADLAEVAMPLLQRSYKGLQCLALDVASLQRVLIPGGPADQSGTVADGIMKKLKEAGLLARRCARQAEAAHAAATSMAQSSAAAAAAAATEEAGDLAAEPSGIPEEGVSASTSLLLQVVLMQAEISWRLGLTDAAILIYQKAVNLADSISYTPTKVHLKIAEAFMRVSQPQCAIDSLLKVAESSQPASSENHSSSPLLWLLVGRAYMQIGQMENADMALSQSNLLDPELPEPWGLLALISVRVQRWSDASKALSQGKRVGLQEAEVLALVAAEYEVAGRWEQASEVLAWAVKCQAQPRFEDLYRLIQAHVRLYNAKEARRYLDMASSTIIPSTLQEGDTMGEEQAMHLAALNELALRIEALPVNEH